MIEVFKILNGVNDSHIVPLLSRNVDLRTRGNSYKFEHMRAKCDLRKYSFCARVVGVRNTLPDFVVCSNSVNAFKNNLDKHWLNKDLQYNWEATLSGCFI